ncbi:MAG: hypothetical protein ABI843_02330 [Dokdonella sp.]
MASNSSWMSALADKWETEARSHERSARSREYTEKERIQLEMHARVKEGCAGELRREAAKVRRG